MKEMKKLFVFILAITALSSCHNYKKDAQNLMLVKDSLEQVTAFRDSSIASLLNDFSAIQANLDSIKAVEKLVTVQSATGRELNSNQKQQILEDIALLNDLLQRNKAQTAALQKKLKTANLKIADLEETIKGLELMVANLEAQTEEQNIQIDNLTQEVRKLNVDISQLNQRIKTVETESEQKSQTIESQTVALNKAYYAFGTTKELRDNGIIEKSGGVIGMGKTAVMKKDFNKDYFTEIDIRNFEYLRLMAKKAKLVTVHTAGSFHFSSEKRADTLFIDNPAEFWKASKYLVIVTD
jgi:predicted RNase H-like nuclease (RuvC/YqgF family)